MKSHHRRTNVTDGLVAWPLNDPRYVDSGEGGMAVYLICYDQPAICLPGVGAFAYGDLPLGGALRGAKVGFAAESDFDKAAEKNRIFWMEGDHVSGLLYLGSCGAALWSEEAGGYWQATTGDLTPEGLALYEQVWQLYAGSAPVLMTFLDT